MAKLVDVNTGEDRVSHRHAIKKGRQIYCFLSSTDSSSLLNKQLHINIAQPTFSRSFLCDVTSTGER